MIPLPVTPEARYAWGDVEWLIWAKEHGHIAEYPAGMEEHFHWKLRGTREEYEEHIANSPGPDAAELALVHLYTEPTHRTLWLERIAREMQPESFLDFGCYVGHQGICVANRVQSIKWFRGRELCVNAVLHAMEAKREHLRFDCVSTIMQGSSHGVERYGQYDLVNAQEVLEHVFDLDATLEELRPAVRIGGTLVVSFPYGPWEDQQGKDSRGHVRLVLPSDLRDLFPPPHAFIALGMMGGPDKGWTLAAVKVADAPFGRIDMERHSTLSC